QRLRRRPGRPLSRADPHRSGDRSGRVGDRRARPAAAPRLPARRRSRGAARRDRLAAFERRLQRRQRCVDRDPPPRRRDQRAPAGGKAGARARGGTPRRSARRGRGRLARRANLRVDASRLARRWHSRNRRLDAGARRAGRMTSVDIVLPVYNEQEGLEAFHTALTATLDPLSDRYRFGVVYVLDRSGDDSFGVLKRLAGSDPRVTIVHLSTRFGHQMSLVAGIDHSRADAVIMMDCDLQHPPAVIPRLLDRFEDGFDIVHAIREYDVDADVFKRWSSRIFYRLQNALSPVEIQPGSADFRLISRKVAHVFQTSIRERGQFLRGLFQWVEFRSTAVSFVSPPRA